MRGIRRWIVSSAIAVSSVTGIGSCIEDVEGPSEVGALEWPPLECDPLVPTYCAFPFPSSVYMVRDATTQTGFRVAFDPETFPADVEGRRARVEPWNDLDGFSPLMAIMAHFPGVTQESLQAVNAATSVTIERSLEYDSPTIVLDAETGKRVPHWVDLDATGTDDDRRAFMIRPAVRLENGRRYIVAVRGLEDAAGNPISPSETFGALRDRLPSDDPAVTERRSLYVDIFENLSKAGVARDDLILAWDFWTASRQNNTGWMVHMRDEGLRLVEEDGGIQYTITSVDQDLDPDNIAYRIYLRMRVPMYLDQVEPLASLTFGADGLPDPNPDMPWAEFDVEVLIPHSAMQEPASLLQYGHGLLGAKEQIESEHFRTFINEYNYIIFGVDFIGFAADDEVWIGAMLGNGRFEQFQHVIERQHQGMLNSLLAMRLMKTSFAADPEYGPYVDPSRSYYHGISQGGIYGGTYMGLTTDAPRGALGVMGMSYNVLLSRSVDFDDFFTIMRSSFPDSRDHMMMLDLAQMLWDRIDPSSYTRHIRGNTLPGTPPHEVLLRAALGDHQVTNYGAHLMVRDLDIPHLDTGLREIWGIETVPGPIEGSGYIEYDFGLPPDPVGNIPQAECDDPHGKLRKLESARRQLDLFLQEGVIDNFCPGGVCSYPDMSGCE